MKKREKGGEQDVRQSPAFEKDYSTKVNTYNSKEGVRNNRNRKMEGGGNYQPVLYEQLKSPSKKIDSWKYLR